jgi:hypothetical protein
MTKRQHNWTQMLATVLVLLEENVAKFTELPAILTEMTRLREIKAKIEEALKLQTNATAGTSDATAEAKEALLELLHIIRYSLNSLARKTGKAQLRAIVNHTPSQLRHLRISTLLTVAGTVLEEAIPVLSELAVYGVNVETTDSLKVAIEQFSECSTIGSNSVSKRVGAGASIEDLIDEANDILTEDVDKLLDRFRVTDVSFFNSYNSARKVRLTGIRRQNGKGSGKQGAASASPAQPAGATAVPGDNGSKNAVLAPATMLPQNPTLN